MTINDTYETAGMRTTCGLKAWDHVPERDAEAVRRPRGAGAVIFGTTNTPTLAGDWQTFNPIFGTTNNPWDTTRTTGGSSGGAAAAVSRYRRSGRAYGREAAGRRADRRPLSRGPHDARSGPLHRGATRWLRASTGRLSDFGAQTVVGRALARRNHNRCSAKVQNWFPGGPLKQPTS